MREPITAATMADELRRLLAAFPSRRSDVPQLAAIYKDGLRGIETDALRGAVDQCIQNDQYFPKVARLREAAQEWMRRNRAVFAPVSQESWDTCGICGARALPTPDGKRTRMDHSPVAHSVRQTEVGE